MPIRTPFRPPMSMPSSSVVVALSMFLTPDLKRSCSLRFSPRVELGAVFLGPQSHSENGRVPVFSAASAKPWGRYQVVRVLQALASRKIPYLARSPIRFLSMLGLSLYT